jgi:hypothetical protein
MKKLFCILYFWAGITASGFAQNNLPKKEDIQAQRAVILEQVTAAAKEVGSEDKQVGKLKAIFENLFKKQDEIRADSVFTKEVKTQKLKEANSEKDWKVKSLLGDKYTAFAEVRKRQMAEAAAKKQ